MFNNDTVFLAKSIRGDTQTAVDIFECPPKMVYNVALRILDNPVVSKDVTQIVFMVLMRKRKSIKPQKKSAGWLYPTAEFITRRAARSEFRRQRYSKQLAADNENTDGGVLAHVRQWEKA